MYGLDINFLNDRADRPMGAAPKPKRTGAPGDTRPLLLGLLGVVAVLGFVAGYWLFLRNQVAQLEARNQELDAELADLQSRLQAANTIRGQIEAIETENAAFVGVFDQILPWSAVLQDLRNRTPTRVQLTNLEQTAGITPEDKPDAEPPKAGGIQVEGVACSFDDINDFVLVMQRSPFLAPDTVRITKSEKQNELLDPTVEGTCPGAAPNQPLFLVDYTIEANLTDKPASQLIEALEQQGTVGLVARLRALQETGVLEK